VSSNSSDAGAGDSTFLESTLSGRAHRLADRGLFLKKFLQKGRTISSAVPSSRVLVESMLRHIDFSRPGTIVELGAGTGPVTELVLERLRPHHRFFAVENDPDFCEILRRRFPEVSLLQMDATRLAEPFARMGVERVDYVLSGLPAPNLPARGTVRLWKWLRHVLPPEGVFIQMTVAPLVYRAFYDRLFDRVNYRMVWWNVPPGGVYCCSRPRARLARVK
jgi:phospholipid N-methyltransferase